MEEAHYQVLDRRTTFVFEAIECTVKLEERKRKRERLDQVQWQQVFAEIYDIALQHSFVLCGHCKGFHDSVVAHGREDRDEAHWDHCPCKDCDAGSWRACQYTEEYRWEE